MRPTTMRLMVFSAGLGGLLIIVATLIPDGPLAPVLAVVGLVLVVTGGMVAMAWMVGRSLRADRALIPRAFIRAAGRSRQPPRMEDPTRATEPRE